MPGNYTLKASTKNFQAKTKRDDKNLNRGWNLILYKYRDKMVTRAKNNHIYKNRTGVLSKSHKGKVFVRQKAIGIMNNVFYRPYVKYNTRQNWIQLAINYYRYKMKRDIEQAPNKYIK